LKSTKKSYPKGKKQASPKGINIANPKEKAVLNSPYCVMNIPFPMQGSLFVSRLSNFAVAI
jgi:hypothetical protein